MARKFYSSGSTFEELASYSRAVRDGDWVFVSGTTGFDYAAGTISDDVAEQTEQCFRNINLALAHSGVTMVDIVRIRVFLASKDDFEAIAPIVGKWCDEARPANTTVVAPLVDDRMKIEIEVTARRHDDDLNTGE